MTIKNKIYLDYNATTPVDQRVVDAMMPFFTEKFGNSGSDHFFGWDANEAVYNAREQIAHLVNCRSNELTFTSGATEAANLALLGFCEANKAKGNHLITCKTEHSAVLEPIKALEQKGFRVTYLDVDRQGSIDLKELEGSITPQTILVCLMLANNETGLIHPFGKIEKLVHAKKVNLMSDITQAVGKIPVDLRKLNIDLAIFSAHKIYGPKGLGALFINKKSRVSIRPYFFGRGQEKKIRPGTLNVPGIVGFGEAAKIALAELKEEYIRVKELRDKLENLLEAIGTVCINSKTCERLPNTTNISFQHTDGNRLLRTLNMLAVSRGSACSANTLEPSHVLKAMGLSDELALASLRISLGRMTKEEDIRLAAQEIGEVVNALRF